MIAVGFTGTREGITPGQYEGIRNTLDALRPIERVHHGDCIGADRDFHLLVISYDYDAKIVVHPPTNEKLRAFMAGHFLAQPKHYLERDQDIVDVSTVMIACPRQREEQRRSGTWATIRMTRRAKKPLAIIYPDGEVVRERWPDPQP